jgi:hypothetical protein
VFKAVEVDAATRRRTGRAYELVVETRQAAIEALLARLGLTTDQVRVDPSRTLIDAGATMWTLIATRPAEAADTPTLRRAGAKHKHIH